MDREEIRDRRNGSGKGMCLNSSDVGVRPAGDPIHCLLASRTQKTTESWVLIFLLRTTVQSQKELCPQELVCKAL